MGMFGKSVGKDLLNLAGIGLLGVDFQGLARRRKAQADRQDFMAGLARGRGHARQHRAGPDQGLLKAETSRPRSARSTT
jgi:hypothetical protein